MRLATARAAPPADRFEEAEATFSALVLSKDAIDAPQGHFP